MNVIMPDSPMRIDFVSFALSYIWSCILCLVSSFSFLCFGITGREEEESFGSAVDVGVGNTKWPGAGEKRILSRRVSTWIRCAFATQNSWSVWTLGWILFLCLFLSRRQMLHHQHRAYKKIRRGFCGKMSLKDGWWFFLKIEVNYCAVWI